MKSGLFTDLTLFLLRFGIGLYLCMAGFGKVMGEISNGIGTFTNSDSFSGLQPSWLPDALALPYGYALPWVQTVVGALLALGLLSRVMAALTFLLIASFTVALAMQFGVVAQPDSAPGPFSTNYIQCAAALLLVFTGPGRWSLDRFVLGKRG